MADRVIDDALRFDLGHDEVLLSGDGSQNVFRDASVVKKLRRDDIGEYRHLGECLSAFLFG